MAQPQFAPTNRHLPLARGPIIGRQQEIVALIDLVRRDDVPLVTMTGPGGVGKTRLALAAADRLRDSFGDGVEFVPLAPLQDPALVTPTIASALGVAEQTGSSLVDLLIDHVGERALLLVLDNVEHVIDAVEDIGRLIAACPNLTVLATSRTPLHLYEEHEFPVLPLTLPDGTAAGSAMEIEGSEAVVLFFERARAVQPSFALTDENASVVAAICHRLDGLPLAIELAVPRLRMFSPQQLLDRLQDPFAVLTGGPRDVVHRQRTLRDTIAWSYDLLNESQRALFRALCVCRGGWTLEAAEAIAPINDSGVTVLSDLNSLVEQNLVRSMTDPDRSLRFGMLETVREFGMAQLAALGGATDLSERHAHYYVSWASRQSELFVYADAKHTIRALSSDLENLRTAYRWVLAQESSTESMVELLVVANAGLRLFWRAMGLLVEGRRWIERGLAKPGLSGSVRCIGLIGVGWIATEQGDLAEARAILEEALMIAEENECEEATLDCVYCLARIAIWQADYMQAIEIHEQGIALARRRGDEKSVRMFLANLGLVVAIAGDLGRGKQMLTDVLEMERESSGSVSPIVIMDLASIACMEGELCNARDLISQALSIERENGPSRVVANCFEVCAPLAVLENQYVRAAYLYGAADALRLKTGAPAKPHDRQFYYDGFVDRGKANLGELAWGDAWEAGRALSFDEAVDYALAFDDEPAVPGGTVAALLSKREIEVLRLLVEGRTNQEIAAELYISPHTAANHVAHILNKLEVDSRTAAATWAIREGVV